MSKRPLTEQERQMTNRLKREVGKMSPAQMAFMLAHVAYSYPEVYDDALFALDKNGIK